MKVAGIDAGMNTTKAVVLRDGEAPVHALLPGGREGTALVAEETLSQASKRAGLSPKEVDYIVATGKGREFVPFATAKAPEALCLAQGAYLLLPSATTVLDVGAEKTLVVRCREGRPLQMVSNDKCASGNGRFLEMVAEILEIGLKEMGELAERSTEPVEVESTCAVFADSEIVSLIHQERRREDILKGVLQGLASRIYSLLVKIRHEGDIAMVGGVARNSGVVRALEEQIGASILVPENPEVVVALGAALIAREKAKA